MKGELPYESPIEVCRKMPLFFYPDGRTTGGCFLLKSSTLGQTSQKASLKVPGEREVDPVLGVWWKEVERLRVVRVAGSKT